MIKHVGLVFLLLFSMFSFAGDAVDINTADAATIAEELKGIGLTKAKAIVKYREAYGPYRSVEDLVKVSGIGEKTLEKIRPQLRL